MDLASQVAMGRARQPHGALQSSLQSAQLCDLGWFLERTGLGGGGHSRSVRSRGPSSFCLSALAESWASDCGCI